MRKNFLLLILLNLPLLVSAQVFPAEQAVLNYKIFNFRFTPLLTADNYIVEVIKGADKKNEDFKGRQIITFKSETNVVRAKLPDFGCNYTWRYVACKGKKKLYSSFLYHFSTGYSHFIDTARTRVRVKVAYRNKNKYYFMSDRGHAMYTLDGEPIWYMPEVPGVVDSGVLIRDLKTTSRGTITFLNNALAVEMDRDGNVLWRNPEKNGDSQKIPGLFHHELTRLSNGNYMVLGTEINNDMALAAGDVSGRILPRKIPEGTIAELDKQNNLKWYWKSSTYYTPERLLAYSNKKNLIESHENAFYFDEKNNMVYASFKHMNQILRISYPEGEVTAVYGKKNDDTVSELQFCGQHSCKLTTEGYIALFNNNGCNRKAIPSLVLLNEANTEKLHDIPLPVGQPEIAGAGGNVMEVNKNTFFISAGAPYSDLFFIKTDGSLEYHAHMEFRTSEKDKWKPFPQYRATLVTSEEAERFLLNIQSQN